MLEKGPAKIYGTEMVLIKKKKDFGGRAVAEEVKTGFLPGFFGTHFIDQAGVKPKGPPVSAS